VRKTESGEIDGLDILDSDGKVIHQTKAVKDAHGRIMGMQ
jgi:hypothetical protein